MGKVVTRTPIDIDSRAQLTRAWKRHWLKGLLVILFAIVIGELIYMLSWTTALPTLRVAPALSMTSMSDRPFVLSALTGKVRLLTFFYSRCGDTCPLTAYSMEQIQNQLKAQGLFGNKVDFVSASFDYAYDKPPVLRQFASHFHADPKGWFFVSGTEAQTRAALQSFGIDVKVVGPAEEGHEAETFLIDQNGNVRKIYGTAVLDAPTVLSDIHQLLSYH